MTKDELIKTVKGLLYNCRLNTKAGLIRQLEYVLRETGESVINRMEEGNAVVCITNPASVAEDELDATPVSYPESPCDGCSSIGHPDMQEECSNCPNQHHS